MRKSTAALSPHNARPRLPVTSSSGERASIPRPELPRCAPALSPESPQALPGEKSTAPRKRRGLKILLPEFPGCQGRDDGEME